MAGVNQLLPFANGDVANVIPFADWNSLAARLTGFQSGIASSQQFNYILAQGGSAGYVIGQLVADYTTETATIAATPLYQAFKQAIAAFVPGNIADGSISSSKIANGAITNAKLANDSVTSAKLADNSVGTEHIQSNAVTADEIAAGAVGTSELANGSVTFPKIASAAIATQQQAEAGTATDVLMTPLRVKQAIEKVLEEDLPMASATQLGGVKISGDDGITIESDGTIAVDFSKMPTDKFEELLRSIRVPIWLTASKNYYVNGTTGSDTSTPGRGESPEEPFKTISACIKYLTENVNVASYTATINVSPGTYTELLSLNNFSRTSGSIVIQPFGDPYSVIIQNVATNGNVVLCRGGDWVIKQCEIVINKTNQNNTSSGYFFSNIYASSSSVLDIANCRVVMNIIDDSSLYSTLFIATGYATINIQGNNEFIVNNNENPPQNLFCLYCVNNGMITLAGTVNPTQWGATVRGNFNTFAFATGGYIQLGTTANYLPFKFTIFEGYTVTGKRYLASNGGHIQTLGMGADYFPGDAAGSVNSSTYSWYN